MSRFNPNLVRKLEDRKALSLFDQAEMHDVPFGWFGVTDLLGQDSVLREAIPKYWHPDFRAPTRGTRHRRKPLWEMFLRCSPEGRCHSNDDRFDFDVQAKIIIDYPLTRVYAVEFSVPARRLGEIFTVAADFYEWIYQRDDEAWEKKGNSEAPRAAPKILNRARGEYVWGHDIEDLVIERVLFSPNPEWEKDSKGRCVPIKKGCPMIGMFHFSIGS